jgi:FRG domain
VVPASFDEWAILSVMQHHGVPTCIMDWTASLLCGLYFTLEYTEAPASPCLWFLNPFALNHNTIEKGIIFDNVDRLPEGGYVRFLEVNAAQVEYRFGDGSSFRWPSRLPVATAPVWGHPMVIRQQGFTLHGTDDQPMDKQAGSKPF